MTSVLIADMKHKIKVNVPVEKRGLFGVKKAAVFFEPFVPLIVVRKYAVRDAYTPDGYYVDENGIWTGI